MQAFSSHVTLTKHVRSPGPSALCGRQALLTQRRPRRCTATVRAMFIWSNEGIFGKDNEDDKTGASDGGGGTDDDDAEEDVRDLPGAPTDGYDHPVFGKTWSYSAAKEQAPEQASGDEPCGDEARRLLDALAKLTKGPDDIDGIRALTSDDATDAFRRIVIGIFGTIPGDAFEVIVNTDYAGVQRLMQSALATGYAFRNAEWRMELSDFLTSSQLPATAQDKHSGEPDYMRGVPRREGVRTAQISGAVEWWDSERDERRSMSAREYVSKLEAENELLRERLAATKLHGADANRILDYMRTVRPEKIASLQHDMGTDALEAFKVIIRRVLGEFAADKIQITYSTSRDYISQLSFWCLLVGYHVRNLEKKFEMTRMLNSTESIVASSTNENDT